MLAKWLQKNWLHFPADTIPVLVNIIAAFHAYKFTHFYSNAAPVKKPETDECVEKN